MGIVSDQIKKGPCPGCPIPKKKGGYACCCAMTPPEMRSKTRTLGAYLFHTRSVFRILPPPTQSPLRLCSHRVVVMPKRTQPTAVSPNTKRTKHAPLPSAAEDNSSRHSSAAATGRGTSPQGTVTADDSRDDAEAEDPTEDDVGSSDEY